MGTSRMVAVALALVATTSLGCDKLGLGKKDGDGGSSSSSGGGALSFLDSTFEGEITMNVQGKAGSKEGPKSLLVSLKTPRVRVDAGAELAPGNPFLAGGLAFIVDAPAK